MNAVGRSADDVIVERRRRIRHSGGGRRKRFALRRRPPGRRHGHGRSGGGRRKRFAPPVPPAGGLGADLAPAGDARHGVRGREDAERQHHLLQRRAAVVAVLLHAEADALAPRRQQTPAGGDDARPGDQHLVGGGRAGRLPPAFRAVPGAHFRLPLDHVPVVAHQHDGAPAGAAALQQFLDRADVAGGPGDAHLIALGQVVVDGVDHHADDPLAGVRERRAHARREARGARFPQVALVEQHRRRLRAARRAEARVPGEARLLGRRVPGRDPAAQQAGAGDLGHRGQGGDHRRPRRRRVAGRRVVRQELDPAAPRQIVLQLPEDRQAHRVDDQHQHRMDFRERRDPARQDFFHPEQIAVVRAGPRPGRQQRAERAVLFFPGLVRAPRQPGAGVRERRRGVAVPEARARLVDEAPLGAVRAGGRAEPARRARPGAAAPRQPARQPQGHLDARGAPRVVRGEPVLQHLEARGAQRVRNPGRAAVDEPGQLPREPGQTLIEGRRQHRAAPRQLPGAQLPQQRIGAGEHRRDGGRRRGRIPGARPAAPQHPRGGGGPPARERRVQLLESEPRFELAARLRGPFVAPGLEQNARHESDGDRFAADPARRLEQHAGRPAGAGLDGGGQSRPRLLRQRRQGLPRRPRQRPREQRVRVPLAPRDAGERLEQMAPDGLRRQEPARRAGVARLRLRVEERPRDPGLLFPALDQARIDGARPAARLHQLPGIDPEQLPAGEPRQQVGAQLVPRQAGEHDQRGTAGRQVHEPFAQGEDRVATDERRAVRAEADRRQRPAARRRLDPDDARLRVAVADRLRLRAHLRRGRRRGHGFSPPRTFQLIRIRAAGSRASSASRPAVTVRSRSRSSPSRAPSGATATLPSGG